MDNGEVMRIILSRKGFDSTSGGNPSPIFPDGRMVSLPIPDKQSPIRYEDIQWQEYDLGALVTDLTDGRIQATHFAHLDPDINSDSLPRHQDWRPIFGQTGSAQGHLQNNCVQALDIFLFFGLFRSVLIKTNKLAWDRHSPLRHVIWGWMQIDKIMRIDTCDGKEYEWAKYHPHFHRNLDASNTLYIARKCFKLDGVSLKGCAGAGVFSQFSERLVLTAPDAQTPSQWELPSWFFPSDNKRPLTYHKKLTRWQRTRNSTKLNAVARGQEFILDATDFPESLMWLEGFLKGR
jgi:hypothetical protein